ncbi:MAG: acyltransferase, partial [Rubrivivax sp.]|nr:acyltransferase [Rubrivivax sp.]
AAHLHYYWYPGAIIFMDTFFLMSSYLITSLLIKDQDAAGRVDFRRFYVRRVRRLFPALLVMLLVYTLAILWLGRPRAPEFRAIGATLFYFMNWARAFEWPMSPYLGHAWSLSIEEQFYALWPLLFTLLMIGCGRRRDRWLPLAALLVAGAIASAAWRGWLATQGAGLARMYNGTDVRLDGLCLGAALAFYRRAHAQGLSPPLRAALGWATPPVALILFVWGLHASYYDRAWYLWQSQVCMLLSLLLVAGLVLGRRSWLHPLLEARPTVFLGSICYGLYIWHHPIFLIMEDHLKFDLATRVLVGVPLTFAAAILSYHLVELPLMTRKPRAALAHAH